MIFFRRDNSQEDDRCILKGRCGSPIVQLKSRAKNKKYVNLGFRASSFSFFFLFCLRKKRVGLKCKSAAVGLCVGEAALPPPDPSPKHPPTPRPPTHLDTHQAPAIDSFLFGLSGSKGGEIGTSSRLRDSPTPSHPWLPWRWGWFKKYIYKMK